MPATTRIIFVLCTAMMALPAQAGLIVRGTDALGNKLIYDTDRDITWYDFTTIKTGFHDSGGAFTWVNSLVVDFGGSLLSGWRLPATPFPDNDCSVDPAQALGFNCSLSEYAHLYYDELGNAADPTLSTTLLTGPFEHLIEGIYWSGDFLQPPDFGFDGLLFQFDFDSGSQNAQLARVGHAVMAVRDGDVQQVGGPMDLPEPASGLLLLTGASGLLVAARRVRRRDTRR